jgi:ATP-dependent Lon protease
MVTALVSLLTNRALRPHVAMTGEISLTGHVLPIGGVKEKVLGAKRAGITEVILPADNEVNVKEDLGPELLEGMKVHLVRTLDQVLELALEKEPAAAPKSSEPRRPAVDRPSPAGIPPMH